MTLLMTVPLVFAFYLLLAGSAGAEQLVSAAVMTIVAVVWSTLLRVEGGRRRYAFTRAHATPWLRAIARIPADTLRIGAVVAKAAIVGASPGRAVHPDFRFGTEDDPVEAARRATAVMAGSLTPDAIVIDVVPGRATALCHTLAATPVSRDPEWLA